MADVPPSPGHDNLLPVTGANTIPLGTRRSQRARRQSVASVSQGTQSVSHDEAVGDTRVSNAVSQNLTPPNDVVETAPTSGADMAQGAPAMPEQNAQPSDQVAQMNSATVAVASVADVHDNSGTVLGKRRQSDASVTPNNKRTKTDDSDTASGAENNEILGSTTEPLPNVDECTQHSDDTSPAPASRTDTPRRISEGEQSASSEDDKTHSPQ